MGDRVLIIANPYDGEWAKAQLSGQGLACWNLNVTSTIPRQFPSNSSVILLFSRLPANAFREILALLREQESTSSVPILVIGDSGEREKLEKALRHGVTDIILRPFTTQLMIDRLKDIANLDLAEKTPVTSAPSVAVEKNLARASQIEPPVSQTSPDLSEGMIKKKFQQILEGNYFDLLELAKDASVKDIQKSYHLLMQQFDPLTLSEDTRNKFFRELELINQITSEAYEILLDDELRNAYAANC